MGLHNIFEGVAVAVPIFYATRSRWKAFAWATLSGVAEPCGALLAWGLLAGTPGSPAVLGGVFGAVAGAMIYVSLVELLPTARRYDPADAVATKGLVFGMAAMATSLVLLLV